MELLNTELDAVNLALAGIGREPVATLDTPDLDAAMAKSVLERTSLDIQTNMGRGWWFNKEKGWKLEPNERNNIRLPSNTLSILEARGSFYDQGNRLTIRKDSVYDTDQHTLDMRNNVGKDGTVEFTLLLALDYDMIPPSARSAIAWRARRIFSDDVVGDYDQHRINLRVEQQALHGLEMEHRRVTRSNYFSDNERIKSRVGMIGGYNNLNR